MLKRAITGFFFVVVLIFSIWWSKYTCFALFLLISIIGLDEFYTLSKKTGSKVNRAGGLIGGFMAFVIPSLTNIGVVDPKYNFLIIIPLLYIFVSELYRKKDKPFENIAFTILGLVYVVLPFVLVVALANIRTGFFNQYEPHVLLGFFYLIWASDTGAYLAGTKLGKHKLFKRISPGKTWEGTVGGAILAVIIAFVLSQFYTALSPVQWMISAVIIVIFGTWGDLTESLFKRSIHVKDSGKILPGHGGILDRFDGVFLAAPAVYLFLYLTA
jgi:phosphatidate cytidylyltransferase